MYQNKAAKIIFIGALDAIFTPLLKTAVPTKIYIKKKRYNL